MNLVLEEVVAYMFQDQGLNPPKGFKLPERFENVPGGEVIDWERVTKTLQTFTPAEFETFCIGEHDDMYRLAMRRGIDGHYAHHALDTLFLEIGA